jgi:glycerophosphodiester phosphodiesterase
MNPQTELAGLPTRKPRSRSLTRSYEKGAKEIQDRMKHTVDYSKKGFKPNTRGDFIQDSFVTLEEALRVVPESTGFDIEISTFPSPPLEYHTLLNP